MDNKEYLESIAKDTRSVGTPKKGLFGLDFNFPPVLKKVLIGVGIFLVVLIIIAMIAGAAGSGNNDRDYLDKLYIRTTNLIKETPAYNKLVKSSQLRSMGTSLMSVLTETQSSVGNIIKSDYENANPGKPEKESITEEENKIMADYLTNLEDARLNGLLDRVYAREVTYQIGMLLSLEHEAYSNAKKDNLKSVLTTSMNNLNQLYEQFGNYTSQ